MTARHGVSPHPVLGEHPAHLNELLFTLHQSFTQIPRAVLRQELRVLRRLNDHYGARVK